MGKKEKKEKNKGGRPTIDVDLSRVPDLLRIGCTGEEVAEVLNISYDTLNRRIQEEHGIGFADYYKNNVAEYKVSLRRLQFRSAQGIFVRSPAGDIERVVIPPSIPMQIFLGKNVLGQSDRMDITSDGKSLDLGGDFIIQEIKR